MHPDPRVRTRPQGPSSAALRGSSSDKPMRAAAGPPHPRARGAAPQSRRRPNSWCLLRTLHSRPPAGAPACTRTPPPTAPSMQAAAQAACLILDVGGGGMGGGGARPRRPHDCQAPRRRLSQLGPLTSCGGQSLGPRPSRRLARRVATPLAPTGVPPHAHIGQCPAARWRFDGAVRAWRHVAHAKPPGPRPWGRPSSRWVGPQSYQRRPAAAAAGRQAHVASQPATPGPGGRRAPPARRQQPTLPPTSSDPRNRCGRRCAPARRAQACP
jgi:hypothetical protein